jgi:hypothetical protein
MTKKITYVTIVTQMNRKNAQRIRRTRNLNTVSFDAPVKKRLGGG